MHNVTSRWNGQTKDKTKDCGSKCPYYLLRNIEVCLWGDAWKKLIPAKRPRTCALKKEDRPEHTAKYVLTPHEPIRVCDAAGEI